MDYKKVNVVSNVQIDDDIFVLTLDIGDNIKPGQFYMLKAWDIEPLLARPISVNFVEGNLVSFAYQVKGRGTKILSNLKANDKVDVLGPIGNGIDLKNINGRVALVSGGIGIAPLLYTAKLIEGEKNLYCGFGKKSYLIDNFKPYVNEIHISTDSGLEGHKGFVTDIFVPDEYDVVICCGPEVMMKKVVEMCRQKNVEVYVLMENRMACGVGACLGCTCNTKEGKKRVCVDGPVFKGTDVMFND